MRFFTLEHSKATYRADFVFYGGAVLVLAGSVLFDASRGRWAESAAIVLAGLASWSVIEYALHRFVLHGMQPFRRWHMEHHDRPTALICTPTILSAALFATLVFVPSLLVANLLHACALTLGVLSGYLGYTVTHHATHHWRANSAWLKQRKRCHALHHHHASGACYGVTSGLWDHVFASTGRPRGRARLFGDR